MTSTARSAALRLLDGALQECLTEYCHPNEFGGYDTDSGKAAEVVVDTLLENPVVLHALADSVGAAGQGGLSPREKQVAALVARGLPNKAIATRLGISTFTVSSFLRRIFAKLGVASRAQMVRVLMERGLLP